MNEKRPDAIWRLISPHAFAHDGLRWHVRAYCHVDRHFKDFILSRFLEIGSSEPSTVKAEDDRWSSHFEVRLIPNPKLAKSQQRTVALDYNMIDGGISLPVRCALLYYFNKRLRLDVGKKLDNPKETPVVVANEVEFEAALAKKNW